MLLTFLHCFPDSLAIIYSHANKAIWNCNWIGMRDRKSARDLTSPLPREALTSPHQSHYQPLPHHFLSLPSSNHLALSISLSHTNTCTETLSCFPSHTKHKTHIPRHTSSWQTDRYTLSLFLLRCSLQRTLPMALITQRWWSSLFHHPPAPGSVAPEPCCHIVALKLRPDCPQGERCMRKDSAKLISQHFSVTNFRYRKATRRSRFHLEQFRHVLLSLLVCVPDKTKHRLDCLISLLLLVSVYLVGESAMHPTHNHIGPKPPTSRPSSWS